MSSPLTLRLPKHTQQLDGLITKRPIKGVQAVNCELSTTKNPAEGDRRGVSNN